MEDILINMASKTEVVKGSAERDTAELDKFFDSLSDEEIDWLLEDDGEPETPISLKEFIRNMKQKND